MSSNLPQSVLQPIVNSSDGELPGGLGEAFSTPSDVARLLAGHDAPIRRYHDAQRWQAVQRSQQQWPCLWRMAAPAE